MTVVRAGRTRLSFHLHNTEAEIDILSEVFTGSGWTPADQPRVGIENS